MIRCLIIEDEPLAAELLQEYVGQIPFLELKGTCLDSMEALDIMRSNNIDLLLLDIHLPGLKGLDFLRTLKNPPTVILTTAYHQYAIQGYELNVIDYLLKPIEFARFVEAVNKVKPLQSSRTKKSTISIAHEKKTVVISIDDIVYIESQKEYIKIQTMGGSFVTKQSLTSMIEELNPDLFLRIHRSFVVALSKIKAFNSTEIELKGKISIPIGSHYQNEVGAKLRVLFR